MAAVGMLMLGAFIVFVIAYSFGETKDWTKPVSIISGAISAAVAGGVFTFIKFVGGVELGNALFYYPLGLAWGALCTNLRWVAGQNVKGTFAYLNIIATVVATVFIVLLLFSKDFRDLLPSLNG